MKARFFLTAVVFVAGMALTSAQNLVPERGKGNGTCNGTAKGSAFVDANNNGICDTYESRSANGTLRKGKGTGTCDGTGKGKGKGLANGQGQGKGKGKNFTDTNQNGVCDTYEKKSKN